MLEYIRNEANTVLTENGAVTNSTSGSDCLDLFATIGALRRENNNEIITRFVRAYTEDADIAMKILFFARDVRGGLGERRVFRVIFNWLADNEPQSVKKNIAYTAEFGRWDDLLSLFGTKCEKYALEVIAEQLKNDMDALEKNENVSLLAKWLPSVNTSNKTAVVNAKRIAKYLGMNDALYRKTLSALRERIAIIENDLREKNYTFDYEKQPSRALFKYRKAFFRNDPQRYSAFINRATGEKGVLNASNVAPYELVEPYLTSNWDYGEHNFMRRISEQEKLSLNATWNSLPDFGGAGNALAVIDTSGSMYCAGKPMPAAVALSLGLYFAEHNKGCFKNTFIEFSTRPQLIELKGETFADKLRYACSFTEVANTDIEAVFDLILKAAVNNNIPQNELPEELIIISDMEFDCCTENASLSNFKNAEKNYSKMGYKLPNIVFWNVASRNRQQPVKMNEQGVALVSGATPALFSMVAGNNLSPFSFMLSIIGSERYSKITA